MRILLAVAFALFAGLMMTRVFKYLHLNFPDVTAFLIAGVLVGPYVLGATAVPGLGFDSAEDLEKVSVISKVALGFIAFDIGNEFRLAQLKKTGKTATVIGIVQALFATILVDIVLIALDTPSEATGYYISGGVMAAPVVREVPGNSTVLIYLGEEKPTDLVTVPDLTGLTQYEADITISNVGGLYLQVRGSTSQSGFVSVSAQSIPAGTEVERGTTVTVELTDASAQD